MASFQVVKDEAEAALDRTNNLAYLAKVRRESLGQLLSTDKADSSFKNFAISFLLHS